MAFSHHSCPPAPQRGPMQHLWLVLTLKHCKLPPGALRSELGHQQGSQEAAAGNVTDPTLSRWARGEACSSLSQEGHLPAIL